MAARRCTQYVYRWAAEPARERLPHSVTLSLGTWICGTGACTSRTPPPSYDVVADVGYHVVAHGDQLARWLPDPGPAAAVRHPIPSCDHGTGSRSGSRTPSRTASRTGELSRGHARHSSVVASVAGLIGSVLSMGIESTQGRTGTFGVRGLAVHVVHHGVPGQLRKDWSHLQQPLQT